MPKIHELSNLLANQIAAGEVIERPASVVKELAENAIDAQATQVQIVLENAGQDLIRVIDNGQGINRDDIPLAFVRHATSKIQNRQDLFKVMSLGFRGEALPSIAAVSDTTLTSQEKGSANGRQYEIKGGEVVEDQPSTGRIGTVVSVRSLFYNTPARLKYLKRPQTEMAKVTDVVNRLALGYPEISFQLDQDGRTVFKTAGNGNLQQVLANIYGRQAAQKMVPVAGESEHFKISGFLSLPELTRSSRDYLTVLVNHRFVKNFSVSNAIVQGYGSKLMVGRFPMGALNIELDPLLVDVNVHPQKSEIRLSSEGELTALIEKVVRARLAQENLIPDALENLYGNRTKPAEPERPAKPVPNPEPKVVAQEALASQQIVKSLAQSVDHPDQVIQIEKESDLLKPAVKEFQSRYLHQAHKPIFGQESDQLQEQQAPYQVEAKADQLDLDFSAASNEKKERFPHLDYIGQMHGTFLFAQSADQLFLIDQHAAQERINYEYYRQKLGEVSADQQQLLVPIQLTYSASDIFKIHDHQDELKALGLDLADFGPNTLILRQYPSWIKANSVEDTVREMIDWLLKDGKLTVAAFREKTAIMMSCKRAIKANMHLSRPEAIDLLKNLAQCENPFNCPHGRPVLVSFTVTEMEKMFKRIQDSHESWQSYDTHPF
ncbi:DNA mismatch repair endonuclease MutL [Eupransor demetentiae]|uniref:DNA mismatch repair protein MutL n=1 Tax=Eupransor demetentiae TaxID=3109584 RepID=A0ABM9N3F7_9LACO|nr:DNA mismatch repair ATPase MutL (MutL) [Lactobacillaceae bacterium LMG 33000]